MCTDIVVASVKVEPMPIDSWPALAVRVIITVLAVYALTSLGTSIASLGTSIERSAKELAKTAEIIYSLKFECQREGWHTVKCETVFRDEAGIGRVV